MIAGPRFGLVLSWKRTAPCRMLPVDRNSVVREHFGSALILGLGPLRRSGTGMGEEAMQ